MAGAAVANFPERRKDFIAVEMEPGFAVFFTSFGGIVDIGQWTFVESYDTGI